MIYLLEAIMGKSDVGKCRKVSSLACRPHESHGLDATSPKPFKYHDLHPHTPALSKVWRA